MKALILVALALLIFGCAGGSPEAKTPEAQPPAVAPAPQPPPPPVQPESRWASYANIGISFDYPKEMNVTEQLSGYPARGTVLIQGKLVTQGAIAVGFINASGISSVLPDPLAEAEKVLKSNTESEEDIAGQAQIKGEIRSYTSPTGVPVAERSFVLTKPGSSGNNVTMYGWALEFYDGGIKALYPVRIFSTNSTWTDEMKGRFVSSFRTRQ